ncbi:MAG: hypothetical protein ABFD18_20800 [Syntrophomonas sp.]
MADNEIIIKIAENFKQQIEIYSKVLDLSVQQLNFLEEGKGRVNADRINVLLLERQKLMETISELVHQNKQLQKETRQELRIDEFVLTRLEYVIDEKQYQDLKMLVLKLGEMLKVISDQDERSQLLMRKGLKPMARTNLKTGNEQVSNAYKQAMQQKPTKE